MSNERLNANNLLTQLESSTISSSQSSITKEKNKQILSIFEANITQTIIIIFGLLLGIFFIMLYATQSTKRNALIAQIEEKKQKLSDSDYEYQQAISQLNLLEKEKEHLIQSLNTSKEQLVNLQSTQKTMNEDYESFSKKIKEFEVKDNANEINNLKDSYAKHLNILSKLKIIQNELNNKNMKGKISEILTEDKIKQLEQWTNKKLLFACFNTNIHPMSGRQFHHHCNMYSESISLIVTKEATIGGYTSQDWTGDKDKFDDKAFVFNLNTMKKYDIKPGKVAICPKEEDMPVFSHDIALTKDAYYVLFPNSYGRIDDKEEFGISSNTIKPLLVEVIVVN